MSHFENSAMGNYVPANQMLDLRLLNAEINASLNTNNIIPMSKIKEERLLGSAMKAMSGGKISKGKATGEKN
jgi:hypothetical protein